MKMTTDKLIYSNDLSSWKQDHRNSSIPFSYAEAIDKQKFVASYHRIQLLCHIFTVPFGVSEEMVEIMGKEYLLKEYTPIYREWEEVLSRRVYAMDGIPDEDIAASLNQYVSKDQDRMIIQEIESSAHAIHHFISPTPITEFPKMFHKSIDLICVDMITAEFTATIIKKVLTGLEYALGSYIRDMSVDDYPVDEEMSQKLGFNVSKRRVFPSEFNTIRLAKSCLSKESLQYLCNSFSVEIIDQVGNKNIYELTVEQYYALVDMFGSSQEVQEVIDQFYHNLSYASSINSNNNNNNNNNSIYPIMQKITMSDLSYLGYSSILSHPIIVTTMTLHRALQRRDQNKTGGDEEDLIHSQKNNHEINRKQHKSILKQMNKLQKWNSKAERMLEEQEFKKALSLCDEAIEMYQQTDRVNSLTNNIMKNKNKKTKNKSKKTKNTDYYDSEDDEEEDDEEDDEEDEDDSIGEYETETDENSEEGTRESQDNTSSSHLSVSRAISIPVFLYIHLLLSRANSHMVMIENEIGGGVRSHATSIIRDTNLILQNNPKQSEAYAIRSKALLAIASLLNTQDSNGKSGQLFHKSIPESNGENRVAVERTTQTILQGSSNESEILEAIDKLTIEDLHRISAEDILSAFVLGGSSDVALANTAEETVREACRLQARRIYADRSQQLAENTAKSITNQLNTKEKAIVSGMISNTNDNDNDDGNNDDGNNDDGKNKMNDWIPPKPWLIQSFFSGYELLSDAFGILPLLLNDPNPTDNALSVTNPSTSHNIDMNINISKEGEIEEKDRKEKKKSKLSIPPSHLLDHKNDENENEEEEEEEEKSNIPVVRPYDQQGYAMLRQLVEIFDSFLDDRHSNNHVNNNRIPSVDRYLTQDFIPIITNSYDFNEYTLFCESLKGFSVIDRGMANIFMQTDINQSNITSCSDDKNKSYNPIEAALETLSTDVAKLMTGVVFDSNHGSILSVLPYRKIKSLNKSHVDEEDSEEEWEDVEDEDDIEDEDDENKDQDEDQDDGSDRVISGPLRSRLLNLCSSIAYLCGDSAGAVQCLRIALLEDRDFQDNYLKLGALLIDMDEPKEAKKLFGKVSKHSRNDPYLLLHQAELAIHENEFHEATDYLTRAYRIVTDSTSQTNSELSGSSSYKLATSLITKYGIYASIDAQKAIESRRYSALLRLQANIACLRGVTAFRIDPNQPEDSLQILQRAQELYEESQGSNGKPNMFLTLSLGEVTCQAGDIVSALDLYKKASQSDPHHPLPYANAARAYQQLQQTTLSEAHLGFAIAYDPTLAMTWVDIAQGQSLAGKPEKALEYLEVAMSYARHVSEIRDVLTAKTVTSILLELQTKGLYSKPAENRDFI